ncbi:MAG: hypothetical protein ABJB66_10750 [Gemmatimonadaceae bacterium]
MIENRLPYGPNSLLVRRFLQRLAALGAGTELEVVARYELVTKRDEFWVADSAVAILIGKSDRASDRDAIAGPLLQLVSKRLDSDAVANSDGVVLRPVAEPALAALLALMMSDLLQPDHFNVLFESFAQAIPIESLR